MLSDAQKAAESFGLPHFEFTNVLPTISALDDEEPHHDNDSPVVRFINNILLDAIKKGASDIHFEPYEHHYRIRFRIDGLLVEVAQPPKQFANNLTARLKIMANLDIAERRLPQDGRITFKHTHPIDCRVNTCPTLQGEKIVLRLLESNQEILNIDHLGLESTQKMAVLKALQRANGLILVTGPTGSGKTVTLYTALRILNTIEKNISTVEDPVEIQLPGINQVHINPKTGLGFADVLRALLRQDPDIIMIGEIRDLETAQIAVKASQTGHLVLSTLHTNSAAETLVRIANMGLPAYNIASSISLIIAQRLVRKLCDHCKQPHKIPATTLLQEGFQPDEITTLQIYSSGSIHCPHCTDGFRGRIGIYEIMPISTAMTESILHHSSTNKLNQQAKKEGVISLREAGLQKVRNAITSLAELNRIL